MKQSIALGRQCLNCQLEELDLQVANTIIKHHKSVDTV